METPTESVLSISCRCGTDYSCRLKECPGESCAYAQLSKRCAAMHFEAGSFLCPSCGTNNAKAWADKINGKRLEGLRDVRP